MNFHCYSFGCFFFFKNVQLNQQCLSTKLCSPKGVVYKTVLLMLHRLFFQLFVVQKAWWAKRFSSKAVLMLHGLFFLQMLSTKHGGPKGFVYKRCRCSMVGLFSSAGRASAICLPTDDPPRESSELEACTAGKQHTGWIL